MNADVPNPIDFSNNTMRAKFKINSVERFENSEKLRMSPVCKPSGYDATGLDEDNTFAKYSPSGSLELMVMNPALLGTFNPGDTYYLDFTKVEKPAEESA